MSKETSKYLDEILDDLIISQKQNVNRIVIHLINTRFKQRQEFRKMVKGMKVKNKDIEQFGCYNLEGNIRSQDGYNLALTDVLKKLDKL